MTRGKVKLVYIDNEASRKLSLKNRMKGLIKKMQELTTLCEVDGCIIIYSPDNPESDMWSSGLAIEHVIQRYNDMPDFEKSKNMADQESFANQELDKAKKQLNKIQRENRHKELGIIKSKNMSNNRGWLQTLDIDYLTYINNDVLIPHLEEIEQKIEMLSQELSETPKEH